MLSAAAAAVTRIGNALLERNALFAEFFAREAPRLARASREMSDRFLRGGRLLAFGRGAFATDAQHVSVEFVHPVIVGKRALPAMDLSPLFGPWLKAIVRPEDMAIGFGPPSGDIEVHAALEYAAANGAMTFALPGGCGAYRCDAVSADPFLHQEAIEILYHTLWETVHVFLEHRALGQDAGDAAFLYPFLGREHQETRGLEDEVAASILMKVEDDAKLRAQLAHESAGAIAETARAISSRIERGGKLIVFGNGGSATDANDLVFECIEPPGGLRPIPAISLSSEPANITALANDVGAEVIFLRQMIALGDARDVAVAFSTSGGSRNVVAALEEARRRGMMTVAFLGYDGGEIVRRELAGHALVVRCDYIPRIQEVQASMYHIIRGLLG